MTVLTLPAVAASIIGDEEITDAAETLEVTNPADGSTIGRVPLADAALVEHAVATAAAAFPAWAATPATTRARLLLALGAALEERAPELAELISLDNGKTLADARAELARAREHLEAAATAPALLAGDTTMDVLPGLDAAMVREPIGVCAVVAPFNFPIMTGLIYWSWALACGNTVIIKASEQAPYAATRLARIAREVGFPPGVINVVHGARAAVEALCDSPGVAAISLVGSSATAQAVYARASATGKRVHAAGGARNPLVVLPDAPLASTADAIVTSAYTMAGQRCLSASIVVTVGGRHAELVDLVAERTRRLVVGPGYDAATQVPPLISRHAVEALERTVAEAIAAGATAVVDGRHPDAPAGGYYHGPTLLDGVAPGSDLLARESFGPLVSVTHADDLTGALEIVNSSPFGNAASIFTGSGAAARRFSREAQVGNVGVNVGVAAPTAHVGFGGRRRSFYGTIHSQGRHAVEFYTDIKAVLTRWP
ncbi:aldehyde dehydrogenase family protein [Georgenia yuyongxinii]|uniref:Aldehyde dehydrogenase family protein n=1 Tax=Georgenia yuyongxinii TaxID=2589797 RepID=A0A552WXM9_9MICO|nr:aldehyde dehydrogenase family protein [Georgenia yuyongxinii]TRW47591.1 aldehyde dehydrogenase family protein [Georgenia yuyongxinii]